VNLFPRAEIVLLPKPWEVSGSFFGKFFAKDVFTAKIFETSKFF
jgi:hypothetical protein